MVEMWLMPKDSLWGGGQGVSKKEDSSGGEPEKRLAVFDENANPQEVFGNLKDAIQKLEDMNGRGTVFDLETGKNLTPKKGSLRRLIDWLKSLLGLGRPVKVPELSRTSEVQTVTPPMDAATLDKVLGLTAGNLSSRLFTEVNKAHLRECVEAVDLLDLPVFHVAKKRVADCKKLVPVKRRRKLVDKKTIRVLEEKTRTLTDVSMVPSIIPQNEMSLRPIRRMAELKGMVPRTAMAMPAAIFGKRLVGRQLMVREYEEEVRSERTITESVPKEVVVDVPRIEEFTDFMEVSKEPQDQLLYIIRDGSSSMEGGADYIGLALAISVVGRNLKNGSRYFHRIFDSKPKTLRKGFTPKEKEDLIQDISEELGTGGGTNILNTLTVAVEEIREATNPEDQPEILLITDGGDYITAWQVHSLLGDDVILHTVMVGFSDNESLREHSTTYTRLVPGSQYGGGPLVSVAN